MKLSTFYDHVREAGEQRGEETVSVMKRVKELGVEGLEFSEENLRTGRGRIERELSESGLHASSICAYFDFGNDPNPGEEAKRLISAAKELGARFLLIIPGFFNEQDSAEQREEKFCRMTAAVGELSEMCLADGISPIMEDYDNGLSPCATFEGMLRFIENAPGLSACFDTGNFMFSGQSEREAYEKLRGKIGYVHLKDRRFSPYFAETFEKPKEAVDGRKLYSSPVGCGEVDISGILALLKEDGYGGVLTIEHYGAPDQLKYLEESAGYLNKAGIFA